jgi:hypothetical protein
MRSSRRIRFGMAFLGACLAILVVASSSLAQAEPPIEAPAGSEQPTTSEQASPNEVKPVRELPELRTANSDTFAQADGSRLLKISLHPINYRCTRPIEHTASFLAALSMKTATHCLMGSTKLNTP